MPFQPALSSRPRAAHIHHPLTASLFTGFLFLLVLFPAHGAHAQRDPALPDPSLTPGVLNPAVTPETIDSTICVRGWTATIRPPAAYTGALKRRQLVQYGYADIDPRDYEEDHRVPLEAGGHPSDPRNLWPEPRLGSCPAVQKDQLENFVHRAICQRRISLAEGQAAFTGDWRAAYLHYLGRSCS